MSYDEKIKTPEEIEIIAETLRKNGKRIAHCHGCFDMIHPGHTMQFRQAKALADVLVVSITADEFIRKGPGRPVYNEKSRAQVLSSLVPVDFVVIDKDPSSAGLIRKIKPSFYIKGKDYSVGVTGDVKLRLDAEINAVESGGGKIVFLELLQDNFYSKKFSSSGLFDRFLQGISNGKEKEGIKIEDIKS